MKGAAVVACLSAASGFIVEHEAVTVSPKGHNYKSDCWKRRPRFALAQKGSNPGAGMHPDEIEPYETVLKDGYLMVGCYKDAMYESGDKFGNNRQSYKMGDVVNSSIVHYAEIIPKEDRKQMTHDLCFNFCRGIPDMGFFGINNGRDCYCTPFFHKVASDSSECDAVCEGEPSKMCGGKTKNSIFEMHMCDNAEEDLARAVTEGQKVYDSLAKLCGDMKTAATESEAAADTMQKSLGKAGDPDASGLLQKGKIWAGKNKHAAEECEALTEKLDGFLTATVKGDMSDFDVRKEVEKLVSNIQDTTEAAVASLKKNTEMFDLTQPPAARGADKGEDQYYNIMYFVDKKFDEVPQTCTGDLLDQPVLDFDPNECAAACNAKPGKCVGYAFFWKDAGMCFLFSKFETAQYYTGCGGDEKKKSFLQEEKRQGPFEVMCKAKLQSFEGLSLDVDKSGKCEHCLKEVTKADRCFE